MEPDFKLAIARDLSKQIGDAVQRIEVLVGARDMAVAQAKDRGATDDQVAEATSTPGPETIEHAQLCAGDSMLVRSPHPEIERVAPLVERIRAKQRLGGKIYRRRIVVLEDWTEVEEQP